MKNINKIFKNKFLVGLGVMVFLVLVMRLWSFGNLLTFKMDQARDIKLIEEAYDGGVGELPLLGPRAAKTYLRLGPIFYYFEYGAMLIFGDQPWSVAVPDLIFSILAIPLFYYFLRQAFSRKVSFLTTIVFASSFFLNQYGRFAWNPNSIPFWSLLYFLGIYKVVNPTSLKLRGIKSQKSIKSVKSIKPKVESLPRRMTLGRKSDVNVFNSKGSDLKTPQNFRSSNFNPLYTGGGKWWLLVAVIGYGVASQLHFTAMLAYPLIGGLFVLVIAFWESWKEGNSRENKNISKNKKILSIDYLTIRGLRRFVWRLGQGISWKYWLGAVMILGVMYLPMVLSEIYTHGDNWVQFKYALSGRGKPEFSLYAKIIQSVKLHSEYFWFSLTSWGGGAGTVGLIGFFGVVIGAIFSVWKKFQDTKYKVQTNSKIQDTRYKQMTNDKLQMINDGEEMTNDIGVNKTEKPPKVSRDLETSPLRQNDFKGQAPGVDDRVIFFVLVGVWWMVMFLLYTKLAFNVLKPRYWLLEAPIFFVVLAVFLEGLFRNGLKKIKGKYVTYLVVIVLVGMNLWATGNWYWELKNQKDSSLPLWHLKLKDQNKIPWGQLQKSANYIENLSKQTDKEVCFYTTGEYRPVYDYIFKQRGLSEKIRRISFSKDTNDNCLFIAIDHHQHRETPRIPKDHKNEFEKVEKREVGFVTIWQVKKRIQETRHKQIPRYKKQDTNKFQGTRNKMQINDKAQTTNDKSQMTNDSGGMTNDKLQMTNNREQGAVNKEQGVENNKKKKVKKPRRVERVRWKDLFN